MSQSLLQVLKIKCWANRHKLCYQGVILNSSNSINVQLHLRYMILYTKKKKVLGAMKTYPCQWIISLENALQIFTPYNLSPCFQLLLKLIHLKQCWWMTFIHKQIFGNANLLFIFNCPLPPKGGMFSLSYYKSPSIWSRPGFIPLSLISTHVCLFFFYKTSGFLFVPLALMLSVPVMPLFILFCLLEHSCSRMFLWV